MREAEEVTGSTTSSGNSFFASSAEKEAVCEKKNATHGAARERRILEVMI